MREATYLQYRARGAGDTDHSESRYGMLPQQSCLRSISDHLALLPLRDPQLPLSGYEHNECCGSLLGSLDYRHLDNLSERLERSFKILKGEGRITEINIAETVKDIRKALLEADVNYKTAKQFTDQVKAKALGQNVMTAVRPGQLMVKITHDELAELMGGQAAEINLKGQPAVILMSGLQGSGKTTFSAKLANYLQTKKNKRVMLVACDVYRPAAIEQLRVLGEQINAKVYTGEGETNPVIKAEKAIKEAKVYGYDVVIVDTAGRLAVDEQMMQEIAAIKHAINPQETLFVVDAMTGQDAVNTAKEFNDRLDFDGVILTKLDGDARGGAALSIRSVVQKPIKFIGTGEKMDALDIFHPSRMADRILGMGDVVSLVERAQEQYDEEEARRISKRIAKNQFDFNDFLSQLAQIKKMGSMKDLFADLHFLLHFFNRQFYQLFHSNRLLQPHNLSLEHVAQPLDQVYL